MGIMRVQNMTTIAPLFADWPEKLFLATLTGCMGEAYANSQCTAANISVADFTFLTGDALCPEAAALAVRMPEGAQNSLRIIAPRDAAWCGVVEKAFGERAVRRERYAIRKDVHHFDATALNAFSHALPPGFSLFPIDGALYRQALEVDWSRDFVSQFRNDADFLARGLGFMVLRGDEPVAGASSYVVFTGGIEIEIDTRKDYRRQGLATACGAALVQSCLARGLYPSWDAHNRASVALAEKLGYVYSHSYPVYEVAPRG